MISSKQFSIGREKRENHPNNEKAVLYVLDERGEKTKYGVWKPGRESPKIAMKKDQIPEKIYNALKREKELIETEERARGLADY